ncbi:glyoxalase/bleomycin resistance protein/dioxygenase superfamily protein [Chelatococcus asaccharovorans]|uniref:Glyoxalase/bleomycin resistance protein/dioxygenase superfamily protein n=2 Tax=Chelatococcus asaccharovorans TaxID=28210 RepID=A0A2V3TZM0_9HYPH|nr:VOC family protein [Chelatococcus asaccharovorans]PXW55341.1 glyoxalase/bleomycin resistance protein/dioxygenase superfamily protein [Chelatococcus asaccharovorans]
MDIIKPAFHHVTFKTSRPAEMVAWYGRVIGATPTFQDESNAWTTNDAANHRVAFVSPRGLSDDPDKRSHNGMHHSAFEYGSFGDLMASYARLRDEGILPAFCLDHGLTVSLYYRDPESNFVELQCDSFGDWERSTEWMRTSADFKTNPIGTFFDPERVYQAHMAGVNFDVLHVGMRKGDYAPAGPPPDLGMPV